MYTRCPDCHTTLVVRAPELAHAGGVVSCGDCRKVFNALLNLFDEPPAPGAAPALQDDGQTGMPPVLQPLLVLSEPEAEPAAADGDALAAAAPQPVALAAADSAATAMDSGAGADRAAGTAGAMGPDSAYSMAQLGESRRGSPLPPAVWVVLAVALWGYLSYQSWQIWHYHQQRVAVERLAAQAREPEAFRIISRDVHAHPSVHNAQMVSLRMRNTADHPQPYPVLEVHLLDTTQNKVAVRRFHADEYLPPGGDPQERVAAQADFALVLQLRMPIGGNGGMTFHVR